jgi:hypothetical protein
MTEMRLLQFRVDSMLQFAVICSIVWMMGPNRYYLCHKPDLFGTPWSEVPNRRKVLVDRVVAELDNNAHGQLVAGGWESRGTWRVTF